MYIKVTLIDSVMVEAEHLKLKLCESITYIKVTLIDYVMVEA